MSFADQNPYQVSYATGQFAADAGLGERTAFLRRTYLHLAGAVLAFIGIELAIFTFVPEQTLMRMTATMLSGWNWAFVILAFMVVSMVADRWARSATSQGTQYAGLILYVVCEAVILIPILLLAQLKGAQLGENLIGTAGVMTAVVFAGLTAVVFLTRADFSWLGRYLALAGFVALGFIFCSIFFDLQVGNIFAGLMVAFAAGYILYYTSNILHHYRTTQHVAAALALFASVALLFWYILMLLMNRD